MKASESRLYVDQKMIAADKSAAVIVSIYCVTL